ncbi:MAG: ABC transporter permease [Verrucomicrobia bacterium]|nr:ABC transporter permease [Verrucomicrobiota bacterium]MBU1734870.1 ABC transporter permease [Verrucomicrobiota bacterium]MBU1856014.1 ABC transporter permease [Verrucomicrobiota bacterium]
MIKLTEITKTYAMGEVAVQALRNVSLTIAPGEFVAIMGPSGSGKSTLLHILGLLDVPDAGSYRLLDHEVTQLSDNELAALRNSTLGFVFQHFNLLSRTSALENTVLPMLYATGRRGKNTDKARRRLFEVGLGDRLGHKPNELSGGQQQRVAIARALIHDPRIILADEPTGNLDSASAEEILEILTGLNRQGITIIMVTHESDIAAHARRIIRMRDGIIQSDERNAGKTADTTKTSTPSDTNGIPNICFAATIGENQRKPIIAPRANAFAILRELPHDFKQAWRALKANKVRSFLSMLGILIGVTAVIAMLAVSTGARQAIEEEFYSLGSNMLVMRPGARRVHGVAYQAGAVTRFKPEDVTNIRASIPSVKRAGGIVNGRGQAVYSNKNWNTRILGAEPDYADMRAYQPTIGRFFTANEMKKRSRVAVIGMTLARELFGEASPLSEYVKFNKVNFQIVGILPEKGNTAWDNQDDLAIIPLTTAMFRLLGKVYLDSVDIEVNSADEMPATQKQIHDLIIRTHHLPPSQTNSFEISSMGEIQAALDEITKNMTWLVIAIASVSLLVGGIGIMNIMLVSVTERTREIGIRKAVGARQRDILAQFLTEALVISVTGGGIGIFTGWLISTVFAILADWPSLMTLSSILLAVGFSCFVGVVFGLWPATKAARLNPIDALRYE